MLQVPFATLETRSKLGWVNFREDFWGCYYGDREKNWPIADCLTWENSQHFAPPAGFPVKWCLRNEHRNSIPMTRHYPDLGSATDWLCRVGNLIQPIRSTTQIWVVMHHQYGISALISQTSFVGETSGSVAKCQLFSQATDWHVSSDEKWRMSMSVYVWATWPCKWINSSAIGNQRIILWVSHESVPRKSISLHVTLWFCPSFKCPCHVPVCALHVILLTAYRYDMT